VGRVDVPRVSDPRDEVGDAADQVSFGWTRIDPRERDEQMLATVGQPPARPPRWDVGGQPAVDLGLGRIAEPKLESAADLITQRRRMSAQRFAASDVNAVRGLARQCGDVRLSSGTPGGTSHPSIRGRSERRPRGS
jgi:hypothetical protein